jgi:hypothetical protein
MFPSVLLHVPVNEKMFIQMFVRVMSLVASTINVVATAFPVFDAEPAATQE